MIFTHTLNIVFIAQLTSLQMFVGTVCAKYPNILVISINASNFTRIFVIALLYFVFINSIAVNVMK